MTTPTNLFLVCFSIYLQAQKKENLLELIIALHLKEPY